jgi:hypothetical protein
MLGAIIGVLSVAAPAQYGAGISALTPAVPGVAIRPARRAHLAALELAAQQHVTLAQAETRMSWRFRNSVDYSSASYDGIYDFRLSVSCTSANAYAAVGDHGRTIAS